MENQVTKPPMILVVERDPMMLTGISAILDMQGYRCFLARDTEIARQATETLQFDLIVLSVDSDLGKAVSSAEKLRASQRSVGLPIIFLAPRLDAAWIGPLNSVGGVYCLPKPFEPELLLELAEKALYMPHLATARVAPPSAHFSNTWVKLS
jgi:DNA-binding response OmpR family regulator